MWHDCTDMLLLSLCTCAACGVCVCACSNTYSALNALAGHYNSFGATAPIPKKRLDRLTKVRTYACTTDTNVLHLAG